MLRAFKQYSVHQLALSCHSFHGRNALENGHSSAHIKSDHYLGHIIILRHIICFIIYM